MLFVFGYVAQVADLAEEHGPRFAPFQSGVSIGRFQRALCVSLDPPPICYVDI